MERTESFGLRNTFQQARQSEFIKLKSGMLNTVEVYYSANYQNRREPVFFNCRQSRFVRRLAACPQRTGLRLGHLNSPRLLALSLLIKMFPRACRQKQPECRLFLLSASPHPPFWLKRRSFAASFFVSGGNAGFAGGWLCQNDYGKLVLCWKMQNFRHLHTLPIFKESL